MLKIKQESPVSHDTGADSKPWIFLIFPKLFEQLLGRETLQGAGLDIELNIYATVTVKQQIFAGILFLLYSQVTADPGN